MGTGLGARAEPAVHVAPRAVMPEVDEAVPRRVPVLLAEPVLAEDFLRLRLVLPARHLVVGEQEDVVHVVVEPRDQLVQGHSERSNSQLKTVNA